MAAIQHQHQILRAADLAMVQRSGLDVVVDVLGHKLSLWAPRPWDFSLSIICGEKPSARRHIGSLPMCPPGVSKLGIIQIGPVGKPYAAAAEIPRGDDIAVPLGLLALD